MTFFFLAFAPAFFPFPSALSLARSLTRSLKPTPKLIPPPQKNQVPATGGDGVGSYAYRDASWQYQPASPSSIAAFQGDLTACLQHAVQKGMGVGVLVHLDNAAGYTWRNTLEFDPLAKHGGYSYDDGERCFFGGGGGSLGGVFFGGAGQSERERERERRRGRGAARAFCLFVFLTRNCPPFPPLPTPCNTPRSTVVLKPVAQALNKVLRPGVKVVLTVNGETGKSASQYAQSWLSLVGESKRRVLANRPRCDPRDVDVGISLNYNRVAGWVDFDLVKPSREFFFLFFFSVVWLFSAAGLFFFLLCSRADKTETHALGVVL